MPHPFEHLAQQLEAHNTVNARVNALELAVTALCALLEERGIIPALAAMRGTEAMARTWNVDDDVIAALRELADNIERGKATVDQHQEHEQQ